MRKNIIFILFSLIFINILSDDIIITSESSKIKLVNNKISEKEAELNKLKELQKELQDKKDNRKYPLKVGLVLSGGGAKGMAHIGVLKKLEEYGIEVDYVTGTSFGSIVGALYSIGYTPEEIEKIMLEMDWNSFRSNKQDREYTSFKYKVQKEKYFFNLEISDNYQLKIPKGILTGEAFYLELKKLFSPVEGIQNFDDFKIPFRAISTNVNTGHRNVVGKGDLAKAVFMSMAIPTVFDPVEDNGEFYVDGGLVENLPVQEVIEMGADIVIAVDITAASKTIDENSNMFQILDKLTSYTSKEQFEKAKKLSDVLIIPDVKDHSVADFTGLEALIEKGSVETVKHEKKLKSISELEASERNSTTEHTNIKNKAKEEKNNTSRDEVRYFTINKINLTGNQKITEDKIEYLSKKKLPAKFTEEEILTWMNKAKAIDIVDRIFYTIDGDTLNLKIYENENKYMRVGLNFSDDFGTTLRIAADMKKYSLLDSEYMLMVEASKYPKLKLQTISDYTYKESKYLGLIEVGLATDPLFIYQSDSKIATYNNYKLYLTGGVGTSIFNSYLIAARFSYIGVNNEYRNGSLDMIGNSSWEYFKNSLSFYNDTRDNAYFSVKGSDNRVDFFVGSNLKVNGDTEFYGGVYDLHKYIPISKKINLEVFASGGKITGGNIPENEYLKIGGLRGNSSTNSFVFYGMNAMRKHTDEFYLGGLKLRYALTSNFYLSFQYNAVTYKNSNFKTLDEGVTLGKDYKHGFGAGLAIDSLLGPLEFVISNDADTSGTLLSLFLGYNF